MVKILITMIAAVVISLPSAAQQERKFIRGGNDLFNKQDFEKAEVEYRKALDTEVKSYEGAFNLGDALYKQKKFDEALQQFQSLAQNEKDKEKLGELYHNIGNTLLAMNKLDESIEAYKQSLRNRPNSQETKYNLEFARKQKQDQQNQDQNKDQNKDQQDQNKDQQNQDQNKDQNKDENKDQNQDQNYFSYQRTVCNHKCSLTLSFLRIPPPRSAPVHQTAVPPFPRTSRHSSSF